LKKRFVCSDKRQVEHPCCSDNEVIRRILVGQFELSGFDSDLVRERGLPHRSGGSRFLEPLAGIGSRTMRFFRASRKNSQVLTGESQSSLEGDSRACKTRRDNFLGSSRLHSQMCVSRSNFITGERPNLARR
jgi:hypothetical protein